ncbi:MAG: ECF-type sigma factor, partial [Bacteroidota bacterium]
MSAPSEVTRLLAAASDGDASALDAVLPLLYTELHELAHRQRRRQRGPATLNTTALLHEAYEKLASAGSAYVDRSHFFRI